MNNRVLAIYSKFDLSLYLIFSGIKSYHQKNNRVARIKHLDSFIWRAVTTVFANFDWIALSGVYMHIIIKDL